MLICALLAAAYFDISDCILYLMAGTVVASGVIQFGILWHRIRRKHFGLRLVRPKWTPGIKHMFSRLGISIIGNGFYQITIIVGTLVASFQSGAVSWLYYSDRIVQLPFAMIGLAVGTVLMSSISNALANQNMRSVYIQQNSSLRRSMMLIMPCVAGLFVLAHPIIRYLFQYGAWTAESTHAVALAIMIQVFALPAMMASQIYSKTLYASQDVKTPVRTSMISLGVAAVIYLALFPIAGYLAIPIGIVTSGYLKNYLLGRACRRRELVHHDGRTIRAIAVKILVRIPTRIYIPRRNIGFPAYIVRKVRIVSRASLVHGIIAVDCLRRVSARSVLTVCKLIETIDKLLCVYKAARTVSTIAYLILKSPENDGRSVVLLPHKLHKLPLGILRELRRLAERVHKRYLRPQDNTVLIAQVIKIIRVRIMAQPDRIYAKLLDYANILLMLCLCQCISHPFIELMPVHASERMRSAV